MLIFGPQVYNLSSIKFYYFSITHLSGVSVYIQVLRNFDSIISSNCTEELENSGIEVLKYSQVWPSPGHAYYPSSSECLEPHFLLLVSTWVFHKQTPCLPQSLCGFLEYYQFFSLS